MAFQFSSNSIPSSDFGPQFNSDSNSTDTEKCQNPIPIPIPELELHIIGKGDIILILYKFLSIFLVFLLTQNFKLLFECQIVHCCLLSSFDWVPVSIDMIFLIRQVKATEKYVASVQYVAWRKYITSHLHTKYFQDVNYYTLNVLECDIDNP